MASSALERCSENHYLLRALFDSCAGKCFQNEPAEDLESGSLTEKGLEQGQRRRGLLSNPSEMRIALHGNKRRRRRQEKTGLCDPSGGRRLRVRDSTGPALKRSAVTDIS